MDLVLSPLIIKSFLTGRVGGRVVLYSIRTYGTAVVPLEDSIIEAAIALATQLVKQ